MTDIDPVSTCCDFGESAPEGFIPLCVPEIRGNEWKYLKECLDTNWVSSAGPFVDRFERELVAYVGAEYAVATVNGTAALHIALKVVGVLPGDEVIVPDLTFIAPVNAIRYCQAHPILVDAHPVTWQIDPDKVAHFLARECEMRDEVCINRRTGRTIRSILAVHLMGLACEIDRIVALAREYKLKVVEDAAQAMGVRYQGRHVGTFGDIGVFSFNGNKIMTTGGGGMIVTNNHTYAAYARYLATQSRDDALEYVHNEVGYNYRLPNLLAAVGVAQLEQLERFISKKRWIAKSYESALSRVPGLTLMSSPADCTPTYWLYTILLHESTTLGMRKEVIARLHASGIVARPFWHPIHALRPYRDCQTVQIEYSSILYRRGVSLPSSVGLTEDQLDRCVTILEGIIMDTTREYGK